MLLLPLATTVISTIIIIYHSLYTVKKLQTWKEWKHSIVNKVLSVKTSFNLISVLIPSNEFHHWSYREQSYTSSKMRRNSSWFSTLLLVPFSFHSLEIGRSQIQSNRLCRQPYFALIGCCGLRNIPYDMEKCFLFCLNTKTIVDRNDVTW